MKAAKAAAKAAKKTALAAARAAKASYEAAKAAAITTAKLASDVAKGRNVGDSVVDAGKSYRDTAKEVAGKLHAAANKAAVGALFGDKAEKASLNMVKKGINTIGKTVATTVALAKDIGSGKNVWRSTKKFG